MSEVYGIVGFGDDEMAQAIKAEYKDSPEKQDIASQVAKIAGEFTTQASPVGCSKARNDRRAYRRKCRDFISKEAKERIPKPVGFIGGFIFMAILSGIISWIVQKMMRKYFDEQEDN